MLEELWEPFLIPSVSSPTDMHVRGDVGTEFILETGDRVLEVTLDPWQMLLRLKTEVTALALDQLPGLIVIHSAGVEDLSGNAMLLVGRAGAGKTTLSTDLTMRGFAFLGDDLVAIDRITREALPLPRPPAFKGTVHTQTGLSDRWRPPDWLTLDPAPFMVPAASLGPLATRPIPIGRLIFPRYSADSSGSARLLSTAEAVAATGEQTHSLDKVILPVILAICRKVEAVEVEYASTAQFLEVLT